MNNFSYPNEQAAYQRRGPGVFAVVLTSVITSSLITLGVLFVTGNLILDSIVSVDEEIVMPQTQTVPSLVGLPTSSAKELLAVKDLRLVVVDERPDPSVALGQIVEQRPLPESDLDSGGKVEVWISSGPPLVKVPDIVGKTIDESKPILADLGLALAEMTFDGVGNPGEIVSVEPAVGTEVENGTKLSVVAFPLAVPVPELVGLRTAKAKKAVKEAGFKVGKISWRYNENRPAHLVLAQEPAAGVEAPPGSAIDLVLNPE